MALPPGFAAIDFAEFHRRTLPELLAQGRAQLVADHAARLPSLALRLDDGQAFTYQPSAAGVTIVPGDDAAATVLTIAAGASSSCTRPHQSSAAIVSTVAAASSPGTMVTPAALGW